MLVKFIMTLDVEWVFPDTSLQEAARLMRSPSRRWLDTRSAWRKRRDCGHVLAADRDVTSRATAEGLDPIMAKVRDVMTEDVVFCYEDQDLQDALQMMESLKIRRLIVLSLATIVSRALSPSATLGGQEAGMWKKAGEVLKGISELY